MYNTRNYFAIKNIILLTEGFPAVYKVTWNLEIVEKNVVKSAQRKKRTYFLNFLFLLIIIRPFYCPKI